MKSIFNKELQAATTPIDGLVLYHLPVYGDERGWFKENWQYEKMLTAGLPDFGPVQNNVSFNEKRGVTRGLHAEPWDKFISIGSGSVFGVWCDIREGSPTYGKVFSTILDPSKAIFVPRGIANGFQTLEDNSVYMYLVNDHWSANAQYSNVSVFDKSLNIDWPIPLEEAELSEKDRNHPNLSDAIPIKAKKTLIVGANGQLGRALSSIFPDAECVDRDTLDISSPDLFGARRWRDYDTILNAAAYTAVDKAETQGRSDAWRTNAVAVSNLARVATKYKLTLVHISTDYVFDGTIDNHDEDEPLTPISVYGQSKAAGDITATTTPKHYILRTSWVIGEGNNFIRTMQTLAEKNIKPNVVDDQIGRLTFTSDLARGIKHLLDTKSPYGLYNFSNEGEPASWATIAKLVYEKSGKSSGDVTPVTTETYFLGKDGIAHRPLQSTLNLDKIKSTGYSPRDWKVALDEYLKR